MINIHDAVPLSHKQKKYESYIGEWMDLETMILSEVN